MFYRPGGSSSRINPQQDMVYSDTIGSATGWLPVNKGDTIAVNISRASLAFVSSAQSTVTNSPVAPEVQVVMELMDENNITWPADQWQNTAVATSRRAYRTGRVRLRIVNINNSDGTGVAMLMQVSRSGDIGAVT